MMIMIIMKNTNHSRRNDAIRNIEEQSLNVATKVSNIMRTACARTVTTPKVEPRKPQPASTKIELCMQRGYARIVIFQFITK